MPFHKVGVPTMSHRHPGVILEHGDVIGVLVGLLGCVIVGLRRLGVCLRRLEIGSLRILFFGGISGIPSPIRRFHCQFDCVLLLHSIISASTPTVRGHGASVVLGSSTVLDFADYKGVGAPLQQRD
jgi:hypothetical protein